ncbi:hypothetical protein [Marinobacter sp. ELB17]|uniref:hypothetical protein n=1 Tax=Marinobacter sp. ELB17 TaxID=270374 RepID=UPI0000F36E79|nr:hypothetical protein [Marinobacter sp. ELB17]EBA01359.1 hypothetical protein MELB17_01235 [Marinobacter sp. ELB17]
MLRLMSLCVAQQISLKSNSLLVFTLSAWGRTLVAAFNAGLAIIQENGTFDWIMSENSLHSGAPKGHLNN